MDFQCTLFFLVIVVGPCLSQNADASQRPAWINLAQTDDTSAVFLWSSDLTKADHVRVKEYKILFYPHGNSSEVKQMTSMPSNNSKQEVRFSKLNPYTRYVVKLQVVSVAGEGPWIARNLTIFPFGHLAIDVKPTNQQVYEGSTFTLPCEASGFPVPKITWLFNDGPIPWRHTIDKGSLVLQDVRHGRHDGRYSCVATSKTGTVSATASLVVYVQVTAVAPTREYTFSLTSQGANLTCYGRGFPLPNITWTKDGLPVSLKQTDDFINKTFIKSRLHLGDLTYEKAGRYYCHMETGVHGQEPQRVSVDVFLRPVINVKPTNQEVFEESTVTLPCEASGFPVPNITWLFNGNPIPWSYTIDKGSLVLQDVRHGRHDGQYTCIATSKAGTVSTSASLVVYDASPRPAWIDLAQTDDTSAVFLWSSDLTKADHVRVQEYKILFYPHGNSSQVNQMTLMPRNHSKQGVRFTKLNPYTRYVVKLQVVSVAGEGPWIARNLTIFPFGHLAIDVKPTNQQVYEGSTFTWPCEASGFPAPNITWLFNDGPIPWSHTIDKGSLVLQDVRHGRHDGRYSCIATSKAGKVSATASLVVYVQVTAVAPTREYTFSLTSQGANLSCYGRGFPLPNITWTKDGLPVSLKQTDDFINKTFIKSRLHLGDLTYEKAGRYDCHMETGVHGQEPQRVSVDVFLRPVINFKPTNQEVFEESTVTLPCEASGFPAPNITWLFNGDSIPWNHTIDRGSLVLQDVRHGRHDGRYSCVATSKAGTVSTSASLVVYAKVSVHVQTRQYTFSLTSQRANLTCYGHGYPLPNITWTKNGLPVSLNQADRVINDTFIQSQLNLGTLTIDKAGRYSCHVVNGVSSQEPLSVTIETLIRPVINVKPTDQKVFEGSTVTLPCEASGFPTPNITWLFKSGPIPWGHSIENDSLVVSNVRYGRHDGRYSCVATSKAGTVSTSASLLVYVQVAAVAPTREYTFSLTSQEANLSCYGRGYPLPNITWTKNGLPVPFNQTDKVINESLIQSQLDLINVTMDKAGRYSCNVANEVQGPISVAIETLIRPVINVKPTDQKVFEGSTVTLPFKASGFPTPNITWLFNGDPILWEHAIENDSLVLQDIRHGRHDGRYSCIATSKAGTVSTSASLVIYVKTSAHSPVRDNIFSLTSQGANLSCYGRGYPLPNITWTKNGLPVPFNQTDKIINESLIQSQLALGNVTMDKAGRYSCNVANVVQGPISVAIETLIRPVINVKPTDQEVFEGSTVTLPCEASGFPTPNITWLLEGGPIPWGHSIENDSLVVSNVRYGRHGRYSCSATSKAGTVSTSASLVIYVKVSTYATKDLHILRLSGGGSNLTRNSVFLGCNARGFPLPSVTWTKDGFPVSLTQKDSVVNDTFIKSRLTFGSPTYEKAGNYSCHVTNGMFGQNASQVIEVLFHPVISVKLIDQAKIQGEDVIFLCKATGVPTPALKWLFNDKPLPWSHTIDKSSLVLQDIRHGRHDGRYSCVATSKAGTVSTSASLVVYVRPSFTVRPIGQSALEGSNVDFKCQATGFPTPTITWLFYGQQITWAHSVRSGSLNLWNVRYSNQDGRYTCTASNKAGRISTSARLIVYKPCPTGWSEGASSCYRIVTTRTAKWDDARRSCISMGGYLVKINSEEENSYVTKLASAASSAENMWIGLSKISRDDFRWTDDTSLSGRYSNWYSGEPNNARGNENCGHLYVRGSSAPYWNDHLCNYPDEKPFYACERGKRN